MEVKEQIQKMQKETCVYELKEASKLDGSETPRQLNVILEKCQCIQISNLINGFNKQ
ncbi:hypothetical protein LCGC14_2381450 [marine sediment metagenome]|uniref:Uncharacterized protein n=1 Tax=marine sediment metagenome TaxID=412755 RepID=A0A0F9ED91_9ZZZZ